MDEQSGAPPARHGSMGLAMLAFAAVLASAGGAFLYNASQNAPEKSAIDVSGFDIAKVADDRRAGQAAPSAAAAPASSLGMVGGAGELAFGQVERRPAAAAGASAQPPAKLPAESFAELCRANEARARGLAQAYTKKYPKVMQYGRDWMAQPDLKKLNDDYMRDHDPLKFIRGLAASKSFPILVRKYASDPAIQAFSKEAIRSAPQGLISAGMAMARKEGIVQKLMDNVMASLGLPPGMFNVDAGPGLSQTKMPDQNELMNSILRANPEAQKAMGGTGAGPVRLGGGVGRPAAAPGPESP